MVDGQSVIITLIAICMLILVSVAGYETGKRQLVIDIDSYGCAKVINKYHGIKEGVP